MVWKMSIDLSRPAVSSMGNLDPYDGLVTCTLLQQAADRMGLDGADTVGVDQGAGDGRCRVLQEEIADFQTMVDARYKRWVCVDGGGVCRCLPALICATQAPRTDSGAQQSAAYGQPGPL
jgi:hypothetical protein